MREITDSDQLFNGQAPGEVPFLMSTSDATLIARALAYVNKKMAGELDRIMQSDESEYLKEAAIKQYNADTEAFTKLHVELAQHFPELTQR
jgi:uncharacterized membrane protein